MVAFRTAWPAFAYSIEDEHEAKRTYAFVLTYLLAFTSWAALALGALAPWWTQLLTAPHYQRAEKGVALLAFAGAVYAGYTVLAIGSGRARRTQLNWVVTGTGAAANIGLNFWLIPRWGMVGAVDLDRRRVRRALRRHDDLRPARLPRAVPVAAHRDRASAWVSRSPSRRARRTCRSRRRSCSCSRTRSRSPRSASTCRRSGSGCGASSRASARARVPARARRARLLPAGGAAAAGPRLQSRSSMNVAPGTGLNRYGAISTKPSER